MPRIMALDYGTKRVGVAVSDPLQMIAGGLTTVHPKDFTVFLKKYLSKEIVELIVVGEPRTMKNIPSGSEKQIAVFLKGLEKDFPGLKICRYDERFTSRMAEKAMLEGGLKKQDRRNKSLVDKISATLILQSYLESRSNRKSNSVI